MVKSEKRKAPAVEMNHEKLKERAPQNHFKKDRGKVLGKGAS